VKKSKWELLQSINGIMLYNIFWSPELWAEHQKLKYTKPKPVVKHGPWLSKDNVMLKA
jgi:hypothetical protein